MKINVRALGYDICHIFVQILIIFQSNDVISKDNIMYSPWPGDAYGVCLVTGSSLVQVWLVACCNKVLWIWINNTNHFFKEKNCWTISTAICQPFLAGFIVVTNILILACNFLLVIHHLWYATKQWKLSNIYHGVMVVLWQDIWSVCIVHHFKVICEFKLELQSGNAQIAVKLDDF